MDLVKEGMLVLLCWCDQGGCWDLVRWSQKSTTVKAWAQFGVTLCSMLPPDVHLQQYLFTLILSAFKTVLQCDLRQHTKTFSLKNWIKCKRLKIKLMKIWWVQELQFSGFSLLYTVMYIDYIFIYYIFFAGTSLQLFFATFKFLGTHLWRSLVVS